MDDTTRLGPPRAAASPGRSSSGEWSRWEAGTVVGGHVIVRKLGQGGMGAVFVARHEGTGEERALKVLIFDAEKEALERFRREGDAQAKVGAHPGIVRVLAAGEDVVTGAAYLVTDLATGGDLKERLKLGPLEPREAAALGAALARGLAHVHAAGVLHRDLKPANVVFDAQGTPKLMDFGLARMQGARRLTATGATLGTPAYMAPEQAEGERVDERADVYGLGAVLYECVTGCAPYAADSDIGLIKRVLTEEVQRPGARRAGLPPALEAIIVRAMARDVSRRYPTAAELAEDLERFLGGGATLALPARRWIGVALVLGLTVVALAGTAAALAIRRFGVGSTAPGAPATPEAAPRSHPLARVGRLLAPARHEGVSDERAEWLLLPAGTTTLAVRASCEGRATLAVIDHPFDAAGEPLRPVVRSRDEVVLQIAVTIDLRAGWQEVRLEGAARALLDRRHVLALPTGLDPAPGRPHAVRNAVQEEGSTLLLVPVADGVAVELRGDKPEPWTLPGRVKAPFFLGETEVSWRQFARFREGRGQAPPERTLRDDEGTFELSDDDPVVFVSSIEAEEYCARAGLRLPTDAEWTHAALGVERGNTKGAADGWRFTCPVGARLSLEGSVGSWGHLHLVGNVWELVQSNPDAVDRGAAINLGSSWNRNPTRWRADDLVTSSTENMGFRVARGIGASPGVQRTYEVSAGGR